MTIKIADGGRTAVKTADDPKGGIDHIIAVAVTVTVRQLNDLGRPFALGDPARHQLLGGDVFIDPIMHCLITKWGILLRRTEKDFRQILLNVFLVVQESLVPDVPDRQVILIGTGIEKNHRAQLLDIGGTGGAFPRFPGFVECGEQHRRQYRNDRNYDQKFDQRKKLAAAGQEKDSLDPSFS